MGVIGGDQAHSLHRTSGDTPAAAGAAGGIKFGKKVGGVNGVEGGKLSLSDHRLAAAAAAVADEVDPLLHILTELYQIVFVSLLKEVEPFSHIHLAGVAAFYKGGGRGVEGHTDIHRSVACPVHMRHLVAAVTDSHSHM